VFVLLIEDCKVPSSNGALPGSFDSLRQATTKLTEIRILANKINSLGTPSLAIALFDIQVERLSRLAQMGNYPPWPSERGCVRGPRRSTSAHPAAGASHTAALRYTFTRDSIVLVIVLFALGSCIGPPEQGQAGENRRHNREDGKTRLPHARDSNPFATV